MTPIWRCPVCRWWCFAGKLTLGPEPPVCNGLTHSQGVEHEPTEMEQQLQDA